MSFILLIAVVVLGLFGLRFATGGARLTIKVLLVAVTLSWGVGKIYANNPGRFSALDSACSPCGVYLEMVSGGSDGVEFQVGKRDVSIPGGALPFVFPAALGFLAILAAKMTAGAAKTTVKVAIFGTILFFLYALRKQAE
jgi:hypothetical protein